MLGLTLATLAAAPARGHDFWILPESFVPAPGTTVGLVLEVGIGWVGDLVARDPALIERFVVDGPDGERAVPGLSGQSPAGFVRVGAAGSYVVAYRSRPSPVELDAARFAAYLREEGLETVLTARQRRGEAEVVGREIFSRCAKSLLAAGGGSARDRELGLRLELVAEADPRQLSPGGSFPVRILFEGRPLAGARVAALPRSAPEREVAARSDADGRVVLPLGQAGIWLIKAVHMVAAPPGAGADWESLWASLTLELPPASTGVAAADEGAR